MTDPMDGCLHFPEAPHPYALVQGRQRLAVVRRSSGELVDFGFVECNRLMPILGRLGGEPSRLVCSPADMRPAYMVHTGPGTRVEWFFTPKDDSSPRDDHGHPLRVDVGEENGGPETWYFDALALEERGR